MEEVRFSDTLRRNIIADCAKETPRSRNGLTITLQVALYDSDGHSALSSGKDVRACLNCSTDLVPLQRSLS